MSEIIGDQEANKNFVMRQRDFTIIIALAEFFMCEMLSQLLKEQGYNVVGRAIETEDLLRQIQVKRPKCIIVEPHEFIQPNFFDLVQELRKDHTQTKFVFYTNKPNLHVIARSMQIGFFGFLYASDGLDELYRCFRTVINGGCYYSNGFMNLLKGYGVDVISDTTRDKLSTLTQREREILRMISNGYSAADIANKLNVSYRTAVNHRAHIAKKLGLDSQKSLKSVDINEDNSYQIKNPLTGHYIKKDKETGQIKVREDGLPFDNTLEKDNLSNENNNYLGLDRQEAILAEDAVINYLNKRKVK